MEVLTEVLDDRVISKGLWPPRLPDLSIQNAFLWKYLKNVTFRNNPHALGEFKSSILHAISDINSYTFRKMSTNLVKVINWWLASQEIEPGAVKDPPRGRCRNMLNLSKFKHPPDGVVWKLGVPAHVSSSSL
ncbi:uncharacterized protein TNCV_4474901 [Trichonephila clavipes]|nr:uncharacterized protein TNCV_4474901 [Trichonephila clavipes]